ncbi:MAG TPA: hypothetical protein VL728_14060 [Cyclobacteriaceae bacterium]|nr:hypothetical protein [Cyclobacteriaceae bacterium]
MKKDFVVVPDSLFKKTSELKRYLQLSFNYAKTIKAKPAASKKGL